MAEHLEIIINAQDRFSGTFSRLKSAMPSIKQLAVGAGAAVVGLGTAIIAMTKSTATSYDAVRKFSDQLGVSTEFLSKYGLAAEFSGIKQETFNKSIQMLQVRIGEAGRGIGQGKDAMDALGVSLRTTAGQLKTSEQILPELADAFHNMTNATERAEAASKIFGQRGMAMLQMFKNGKAGLAEMTAEAEKFGLVISEKAANNAAEFNDSLTRLGGSLKGVKNAIAEELMPTLAGLANSFADFVAENRMQIVDFAKSFLMSMSKIVEYSAYGVATIVESWRGLQMVWNVLKIAFAELSIALNKGINFLVEKLQWMLEKVNFRGIFDNDIAALNAVKSNVSGAIDEMVVMRDTAVAAISSIAGDTSAFEKIAKIKEYFKTAMSEIRAAGMGGESESGEVQGIGLASSANVAKTQENLKALQALYDQYLLDDEGRLTLWYEEQQALYAGNLEALSDLDEIYAQRKSDLQLAQKEKERANLDELKEMYNQYMLSDLERLDIWYAEQQEKYGSNLQAQEQLALIHAARIDAINKNKNAKELADDKKFSKDKLKITNELGSNLTDMASMFGEKGKAIAKASSTAQAIMSTYAGAANAMRDVPYPWNFAAAASVIVAGLAHVAKIRSAHGGLTNVPKEQTYLLDKGERVLSPNQNQELMEFIRSGGGGGTKVDQQNNTFEIFPNATNADALKYIGKREWIDILNENLLPAMKELKAAGVMI